MILTLLLWLAGSQDASWPALPPKLQENESLRQVYEAEVQNGSAEGRAEACAALLAALPDAEPAAQAEFLIGLAARNDLDFASQLAPACRRLNLAWSPFSARLEEILRAAVMPDADERLLAIVPGALRVAGALGLEAPTRVEAIAALLDEAPFRSLARAALLRITGREFSSGEAFSVWWESAKGQSRVEWLLAANAELRSEVLGKWKSELASNPARALEAVLSDKREVRELGAQALAAVTAEMVDQKGRHAGEVLDLALARETEPGLRAAFLRRLAPMKEPTERLAMLEKFMLDPNEDVAVRLAACDGLVIPELVTESFDVLLASLQSSYVRGNGGVKPPLPVRRRLMESMQALLRRESDFTKQLWQSALPASAVEAPAEGEAAEEGSAEPVEAAASGPDPRLTALEGLLVVVLNGERDVAALQASYRVIEQVGMSDALYLTMLGIIFPVEGELTELPIMPTSVGALGAVVGRRTASESDVAALAALLAHRDEEVRYAAVQALGSTDDERAYMALAEHLGNAPGTESLSRGILQQLKRSKYSATVPHLLSFVPGDQDRNRYRDVLERQINGDVALRMQAVRQMLAREDWEMAYRLDRQFPVPAEGESEAPELTLLRAQVAGYWALAFDPEPKPTDEEVTRALALLAASRALENAPSELALLEGRLHLKVGQHAEAFADLAPLLAGLPVSEDTDALVIATLSAAKEAGLGAAAMELEKTLPGLKLPTTQEQVAALFDSLRPIPVEPVVQTEAPEQPKAEGSPAPAQEEPQAEGGQSVDPAPQAEPEKPAKKDPGGGGAEPKPEEPGSGDGNRP